jgi:hypothetical protein
VIELVVQYLLHDPRAAFLARVFYVLSVLCPCGEGDGSLACQQQLHEAAEVITAVALEDSDPEDAMAVLAGAGAHETRFQTRVQEHGPAVSWFQLEVRDVFERARYLHDDRAAAREALRIARGCRRSMVGYASGNCWSTDSRVLETASQLRSCIESARRGGSWRCSNWSPPRPARPLKGKAKGKAKGRGSSREGPTQVLSRPAARLKRGP